eukprot:TRINITY_DN958_c0_g2_i23.p1 TRINITY_DN958_c0_g2~~TRINITY_DN958_c0_g2_i23.p1  ORF type:complete len:192 (+),score=36.30 TRINITY_DN958_c0_g2_i23:892-1467(+)
MFYSHTIFASQMKEKLVRIINIIVMATNVIFTVISTFTSDKLGRRVLLIGGSIGCGIGLFLAGLGASKTREGVHETTPFVVLFDFAIFFFIASFGLSHGPICWLYMSEILPLQWMGYGTASSWVFTNIVGLSVPALLRNIKAFTYEIFFICMCFSTVYVFAFIKETKGLTKREIMKLFESKGDETAKGLEP